MDINECLVDNPCKIYEKCKNLHGSWECIQNLNCHSGYAPSIDGSRCVGMINYIYNIILIGLR